MATADFHKTIRNTDYYVDPINGADGGRGNGSQARPFATLIYALSRVPRLIRHRVRVFCASGTYTNDFPASQFFEFDEDGTFALECTGTPTQVAGPFTIGTYTNIGSGWQAKTILVPAAGWVANAYANKYVLMTSGAWSGYTIPIHSNTTDTLWCHGNFVYPSNGDTFTIVEPSAVVSLKEGLNWGAIDRSEILDTGAGSTLDLTRLGIAGFKFISEATQTQYGQFQLFGQGAVGRSDFAITFCTFVNQSNTSYTFSANECSINGFNLYDPTMFNSAVHNDWNSWGFVVANNNEVAGSLYDCLLLFSRTILSLCCCGGKVEANRGSSGVSVTYSAVGQLRIWRAHAVNANTVFVDTIDGVHEGLRQYSGDFTIQYVYVTRATEAWRCDERGSALVDDFYEVDTANVSGNALLAGPLATVAVASGVAALPAGTAGQVQWIQGAPAPVAWPAADNSITDGQGARVTRD